MLLPFFDLFIYRFLYLLSFCDGSTATALAEFIVNFEANQSTVTDLVDFAVGSISYGLSPDQYGAVRSRVVQAVVSLASRPRSRLDASHFDYLLATSASSKSDMLAEQSGSTQVESIDIVDSIGESKTLVTTIPEMVITGNSSVFLCQHLDSEKSTSEQAKLKLSDDEQVGKSSINHFNTSRRTSAKFTLLSSTRTSLSPPATFTNSTQKRWKRRTL